MKITHVVLAAVAVFGLAGCSGNAGNSADTNVTTENLSSDTLGTDNLSDDNLSAGNISATDGALSSDNAAGATLPPDADNAGTIANVADNGAG